jgi:hypothetical protein
VLVDSLAILTGSQLCATASVLYSSIDAPTHTALQRVHPMIDEDLAATARESFALALANCGDCRDYHATWPYVRASGFRLGATVDRAVIAERLASLGQNPRVLIVGSADTGQVAAVANGLAGREFALTLVDVCSTPLKLCAAFAARHGIPLETHKRDVRDIEGLGNFDVILLHNFINFIPVDHHVAVLSGLRRALANQGRVWMFQRIYGDRAGENRKAPIPVIEDILDAMRARNIALPESREVFAARILAELASSARQKRTRLFKTAGDVEALLREAGFADIIATAFAPAADGTGDWRPPNTRYLFDAG